MTSSGPKLSAARIVYIDPDECASTVGYRVEDNTDDSKNYSTIDFGVDLSDCSRTIRWSFYVSDTGNDNVLKKMDTAINMLKEARIHLKKCIKKKEKHAKLVAARKAATAAKAEKLSTKEHSTAPTFQGEEQPE